MRKDPPSIPPWLPCIFRSTPIYHRATPQLGRLHGHEIEGYIEEAKQRCPKGGGYPEAPSRRPEGGHHSQASSRGPEGGHHSKPSIGGQEGGLHSEAEVRSQDRQSRGEDRYGGCQERR
jgi:hypothetical protein